MPQNSYLKRQTITLAELASYQPCNFGKITDELYKFIGDQEEFCITSQLVERMGRAGVVNVGWFAAVFLTESAHQALLWEISDNFYEGYHRYADIDKAFQIAKDSPRCLQDAHTGKDYYTSFKLSRDRMHKECCLRALVTILREGERQQYAQSKSTIADNHHSPAT